MEAGGMWLVDPERERRRLFWNVVVGCTGFVACVLIVLCGAISESLVGDAIGLPGLPILVPIGIVFCGIAGNICYTGGGIVEAVLGKLTRQSMVSFGLARGPVPRFRDRSAAC